MTVRWMLGAVRWLILVGVAASLGSNSASAVVLYGENWDVGDTNGAIPSTTSTVVVRDNSVGNPPASIALRRELQAPIFDIGVTTESAAFPSNLTGLPLLTASFDALYDTGAFTETWLRFRYQDATFDGWHYVVANAFPAGWQSHSASFDPSWTDVEAAANGWVDETGGTVSWQTLMSDIYNPEIRFVLGDQNSAIAHVDNVLLEAIPEPTTAWLLVGSLGLGLLRRERRRHAAIRRNHPHGGAVVVTYPRFASE